jgi:predicted nucleic acid-binding protein
VAIRNLSIIIDADIARSSGTTEHPLSSGSRALLESVKNNKHKIAMCPLLFAEWKKHHSVFAKRWLSSMIAKKQIQFVKPNPNTKEHIEEHIFDEKIKAISIKDSHLIDAALHEDKIIASNDDNARNAFITISGNYKCINEIVWFNAIKDRDFIEDFFVSSKFIPDGYYLKEIVG